MPSTSLFNPALIHSRYKFVAILLISLFIPFIFHIAELDINSILRSVFTSRSTQTASMIFRSQTPNTSSRPPVYFLGIGGPNFMENTKHPAYSKLGAIGQEITKQVKPKAVVVISAHWQGGPNKVQVNVAEKTDIIYDFHGFPPHYYEFKYPYKGSPELAEKVIAKLGLAGISTERVARGLDHGVWVGFIAAFDPVKNPLNVPIVQVSLFGNEDPDQHYRMGQALESLRDEGVLIIGAGMAVHNLYDFRAIYGTNAVMPYVSTFDKALKDAAAVKPEERQEAMVALIKSGVAREAHPSLEHLLPIYVAAGAAGQDLGEQVWTFGEASLSWAQFRFGDVVVA